MIGAVHQFIVRDVSDLTADEEGRWTTSDVDTAVWGSVDELTARELLIAAQAGQSHDVAIRADLGVEVSDRHLVEVVTPAALAGLYKVDTVRVLRTHQRVLCSKTTIREWVGGHP